MHILVVWSATEAEPRGGLLTKLVAAGLIQLHSADDNAKSPG